MSSHSSGLARHPPFPQWLEGPHGKLAFFPYPADSAWLHVVISHGFAEHSGWWHHVGEAFRERGVSAYLFDHYHHGRSEGRPGDVAEFSRLSAGLRHVLEQAVMPTVPSGAPVVLLSHSNGALVALNTLPALPSHVVSGLVLSSPFLGMPFRVATWGTQMARLLRLVHPGLRLPLPNRPYRLTSDQNIWPHYHLDPLRFRHITVRFFLAMRRALVEAGRSGCCGGRPLLVLAAGQEQVVSPGAMRRFFDQVQEQNKIWREFPGLRHEVFNEPIWEEILDGVVEWCRDRFAGPRTMDEGS